MVRHFKPVFLVKMWQGRFYLLINRLGYNTTLLLHRFGNKQRPAFGYMVAEDDESTADLTIYICFVHNENVGLINI